MGIPTGLTGYIQYNSGYNTFAANPGLYYDIADNGLSIGFSSATTAPTNGFRSLGAGVIGSSTGAAFSTLTVISTGAYNTLYSGTQTITDSSSNIYSTSITSTLNPSGGASIAAGSYISPIFNASSTKPITGAYGAYINTSVTGNAGIISNLYGGYIGAGSASAATIANSYGMYVNTQTAGTIRYTAAFLGTTTVVGIGTATPNILAALNIAQTGAYGLLMTGTQAVGDTSGNTYGINFTNTLNPSGGGTNAYGINVGTVYIAPSGKTITNAAGYYTYLNLNSNVGTITKAYGMLIDTGSSSAGTITTSYGLYVNTQTAGTTKYTAIFTGGAPLIGMGTATPNAACVLNISATGSYNTLHSGTQTIADSSSDMYSVYINSTLNPAGGAFSAAGLCLTPTINAAATKPITGAYGAYVNTSVTGNAGIISNLYGAYINVGSSTAGIIGNSYGLYVNTQFAGTNRYTAIFAGNPTLVGIGTALPSTSCVLNVSSTNIYNTIFSGTQTLTDGSSNIYAISNVCVLAPASGAASAIGIYNNPAINVTSISPITGVYGCYFSSSFTNSSNVGIISTLYNTYISAGGSPTGVINKSYGLYVNTQTAGTNAYTAVFTGGTPLVGIGTTGPKNALDVNGSLIVGSGLAGISTASTANTVWAQAGVQVGTSSNYTLIAASGAANNYTLTLPATAGSSGQVLTTDGLGNTSWTTSSGGGSTGPTGAGGTPTGTTGYIQYNSGHNTFAASTGLYYDITDNGLAVGFSAPTSVPANSIWAQGNLKLGTTGANIQIAASGASTGYTLTLPATAGTSGQVLTTFGAGMTTWANSMTQLVSSTLSGATGATISYSVPSNNFTHLRIIAMGRCTDAATHESVCLRFNNDSGSTNYDRQYVQGNNGTASAATSTQQFIYLNEWAAASATSGECGISVIDVPFYNNTNFYKTVSGYGFTVGTSGTASTFYLLTFGGNWKNTSAITSIQLFDAAGGGFDVNTQVTIYGY